MKKITVILAGLMMMGMSTVASALSIKLTDGTTSVTVSDGGFYDANAIVGVVGYNGTVGDFIVNVATGISNPILGSSLSPLMDLNSINVSYNGPAVSNTLKIYLTDTSFSSPATIGGFAAAIGGTTSGTVKYSTYLDASNNEFAETTLLTSALYNGASQGGAFSGLTSSVVDLSTLVSNYSLTQELEITHAATGGSTSFDATLQPVPEPGTIVLLGAGLLGLGFFGRRRMQK